MHIWHTHTQKKSLLTCLTDCKCKKQVFSTFSIQLQFWLLCKQTAFIIGGRSLRLVRLGWSTKCIPFCLSVSLEVKPGASYTWEMPDLPLPLILQSTKPYLLLFQYLLTCSVVGVGLGGWCHCPEVADRLQFSSSFSSPWSSLVCISGCHGSKLCFQTGQTNTKLLIGWS